MKSICFRILAQNISQIHKVSVTPASLYMYTHACVLNVVRMLISDACDTCITLHKRCSKNVMPLLYINAFCMSIYTTSIYVAHTYLLNTYMLLRYSLMYRLRVSWLTQLLPTASRSCYQIHTCDHAYIHLIVLTCTQSCLYTNDHAYIYAIMNTYVLILSCLQTH